MTQPRQIPVLVPVIVHLGSASKKKVERLEKGRGPLMAELNAVIDEVLAALPDSVEAETVMPVVAIYRKKRKRAANPFFPFPFPGLVDDDD